MNKVSLRKMMAQKRSRLSLSSIAVPSKVISRKILNLTQIQEENKFSIYLPIDGEIDTRIIINSLIDEGKMVHVPAYLKNKKDYQFVEFTGWEDLIKGPYEILQPKREEVVDPATIEVAILPGLAFDKNGVRLGYGKGVFDRLLGGSKSLKIGLAYDFQIVDEIPKEKHDLTMDIIISERRIIRNVVT